GSYHLFDWFLSSFSQSLFDSGHGGIQPVGALGREHPTWVLGRKRTDLVELFDLFLSELELHSGKVVLQLVETLGSENDRRHHRLCQQPRKGDSRRTTAMGFSDWSHGVEDFPGPFLVDDGKIELRSAGAFRSLVLAAKLT